MIISYIFQKGHILNTMMIMKYPKSTWPWIFQGDFTHSKRVDFRGEVSSLCPQVLIPGLGRSEVVIIYPGLWSLNHPLLYPPKNRVHNINWQCWQWNFLPICAFVNRCFLQNELHNCSQQRWLLECKKNDSNRVSFLNGVFFSAGSACARASSNFFSGI